jgi:hypothetical protein
MDANSSSLTGAAIAVASPGYKKIGTLNWFVVISNKPSD